MVLLFGDEGRSVGAGDGDLALLAFSKLLMCDSRNFKIILVDYGQAEQTTRNSITTPVEKCYIYFHGFIHKYQEEEKG